MEINFLEREGPHPCFSTPDDRGGQALSCRTYPNPEKPEREVHFPTQVWRMRRIPGKPLAPVTLVPSWCFCSDGAGEKDPSYRDGREKFRVHSSIF